MRLFNILYAAIFFILLSANPFSPRKYWSEHNIIKAGACHTFNETPLNTLVSSKNKRGNLIYENKLAHPEDIKNWVLEGPARIEFKENWMHLFSPGEEGHHVLWCPEDFPSNFMAEWELQNQETDAGLCILFFSALGVNGDSIFDPSFSKRNGVFSQYTKSEEFNNYHISYYANGKDNREREVAHLRKNKGFNMVQVGENGIPVKSTAIHKMQLIKNGPHITCFVDNRKIIDWTDDGRRYGPVLGKGKIGFRQMNWTHFKYRNLRVYSLHKLKYH